MVRDQEILDRQEDPEFDICPIRAAPTETYSCCHESSDDFVAGHDESQSWQCGACKRWYCGMGCAEHQGSIWGTSAYMALPGDDEVSTACDACIHESELI
jgi:hypothetical protein